LEAATMLEDREEGGSSSSSFTAAADRRRRTATSKEDNQQIFMAKPLLASTQRERASDLRRGRDAAFWRRVDGLVAKIAQGATGWGWMGGDDNDGGSPIGNDGGRSNAGKGQDQERRCAIGRLIETEISAADAQDGQSPPPNPTPV
jgi:hypothetical protein